MSTDPTTAALSCVPSQIRVFHTNHFRDACISGYQPTHSVTEVFSYTTARSSSDSDDVLLSTVWQLFNVGDDPDFGRPDDRAVDYRRCRNRSLSVGDVVGIDHVFYACASSGWARIEPPVIDQRTGHGTTSLSSTTAAAATAEPTLRALLPGLAAALRRALTGTRRGRRPA